jgi:hypothetical protein
MICSPESQREPKVGLSVNRRNELEAKLQVVVKTEGRSRTRDQVSNMLELLLKPSHPARICSLLSSRSGHVLYIIRRI